MSDQNKRNILARYRHKYRGEKIEIPEWLDENGEILVLEVRSMLGHQRADYMTFMSGAQNPDTKEINFQLVYPMLVKICTFDPETGECIFEDDDDDFIKDLDAGIVERLNRAAMRLNGLDREEETAAGNV